MQIRQAMVILLALAMITIKKKLSIAKVQDKTYAKDGIYTHEYILICQQEEKTITCPLHVSIFKLDNGVKEQEYAIVTKR